MTHTNPGKAAPTLLADRRPDWRIGRGGGTRTGADLIVDHVGDRGLVDDAGNPTGGTR